MASNKIEVCFLLNSWKSNSYIILVVHRKSHCGYTIFLKGSSGNYSTSLHLCPIDQCLKCSHDWQQMRLETLVWCEGRWCDVGALLLWRRESLTVSDLFLPSWPCQHVLVPPGHSEVKMGHVWLRASPLLCPGWILVGKNKSGLGLIWKTEYLFFFH